MSHWPRISVLFRRHSINCFPGVLLLRASQKGEKYVCTERFSYKVSKCLYKILIVALVKVNTYNGSAVFNIYCSASDFPRVSRRPQKNLNLLKCDKTENQIAYNRILDNVWFVSSQLICSGNSQPDTTTFPSVSFLETEADFFKWLVSMNILFLMKIYKYIIKNV